MNRGALCPVVRCESVSKSYQRGERYVLDVVSFEIPQGALFAVIGPNGAGKITLPHLILGLLHPLRGGIGLFGSNDVEAQRGRLGYLPERGNYPLALGGFTVARRAEAKLSQGRRNGAPFALAHSIAHCEHHGRLDCSSSYGIIEVDTRR